MDLRGGSPPPFPPLTPTYDCNRKTHTAGLFLCYLYGFVAGEYDSPVHTVPKSNDAAVFPRQLGEPGCPRLGLRMEKAN